MVVMATLGRGPLSRFRLGSVADGLLRMAAAPLLLVRPTDQAAETTLAPPFRHALVPLDGSALAEQVLAPALGLG